MTEFPQGLHEELFHIDTENFGTCEASFQVELPGNGAPSGQAWLKVIDENEETVLDVHLSREDTAFTVGHVLLLGRLYDAFNAGAEEHAHNILKGYLDTMDPLSDIGR